MRVAGDYGATRLRAFGLLTPHLFGDFAYQGHLRPLLLFGELVADFAAGEAALGRQAQVLKRYVLRRFMDAVDDGLLVLKLGAFRGDEAQHHLLAGRYAGQRREAAGALVVEFQEEGVDVLVCQQCIGHAVVAALAGPRAVEVAAAHVRVDAQVGRRCVEHAVVDAQQLLLDARKPALPDFPVRKPLA